MDNIGVIGYIELKRAQIHLEYKGQSSFLFRPQGKESYGHRFFSSSAAMTQLRSMKTSLSACCKQLQANIAALDTPDWAESVGVANPSDEQRDTLRSFLPKCLK